MNFIEHKERRAFNNLLTDVLSHNTDGRVQDGHGCRAADINNGAAGKTLLRFPFLFSDKTRRAYHKRHDSPHHIPDKSLLSGCHVNPLHSYESGVYDDNMFAMIGAALGWVALKVKRLVGWIWRKIG